MKRLTPKEIERLYELVIRAVEHGQLQLQAEGGPHKASDGLTYPQFFGTAELGDCSMNGDEGDPTCGVTVTLPAKTLKWLWVRVAGSIGGKTKALNAKKSARRTSRKSQNASDQATASLKRR